MALTQREILDYLSTLPPEEDPNVTRKMKDFVINQDLNEIESVMMPMLEDSALDEQQRFYIYYSLSVYYRRYEHHSLMTQLVKKYASAFSAHPLNNIVMSLDYKFRAIDDNKPELFRYAIAHAKEAIRTIKSAAVRNNYAELVVTALDENYNVSDEDFQQALQYIDEIIFSNDAYAKWHCIKGRLLAYKKDFYEAKECIRRAVDLEDASQKDSLLRISQYNNFLLDIKTKEAFEEIKGSIASAKAEIGALYDENETKSKGFLSELDNVKSKYLEFLAFFSSIIAFITASINIVSTYSDFSTACGLIVVFCGAQSLAFCIFRLLISYNNTERQTKQNVLSILLSFSLMAVGFLIGKFA